MKLRIVFVVLLVTVFTFLHQSDLLAQCPMCKIAAESNLENGGSAGKGLNMGILYILLIPYTLVATLGFIWWRNKKSDDYDDTAKWN